MRQWLKHVLCSLFGHTKGFTFHPTDYSRPERIGDGLVICLRCGKGSCTRWFTNHKTGEKD